jgi:NitT/TauT family transport system substrate-binding protein
MKLLFVVLSLLCLLGFQNAQAESAPPKAVDIQNRIVLLVDEIHAIRNFPVVLADRLGYLRDGNMAVTVMNVRYDAWHGDMLMDGRIDAVMAYYHHNIVNQSQGRFSEAIVTLGITPGMKVLVSNRSKDKFKTLADLKGSQFIAGGAGSSKTTVANYLVLAGGNQIADYTRLGTDGKDKNVDALRNGGADFVVAPIPDGDFYEAQGVATVFADLTTVEGTKRNLGALFPSSTVFMANERVKAHPEMAQHLANAFVRTLKYINTHSAEEIAELIPIEIRGKDRAAYLKILKEQIPMFANDGTMPVQGAEKEWKVLAEFNPKFKPVKLEQTYTNTFVNDAIKKFGY